MVSSDDIDNNALSAEKLIRRAVSESGASLVLLPENFLCFSAKRYAYLANRIDRYIHSFASLAKELKVNLVLGSVPLSSRSDGSAMRGKLMTSSLVLDQQGRQVARYDKRHLFDVDVADSQGTYRESETFEPGQDIVTAELGKLKLGLSICYDLRFPIHYQSLRDRGANVLLVPAAFTAVTGKAHWEPLLRARAIENQCYVVASNQGGQHSSTRSTWGHSMIIDPWGEILSSLEMGEGYCSADFDLKFVESIRQSMPVQQHRNKAGSLA
jgi:nitrilase